MIIQRKEDFYDQYDYLKPECEISLGLDGFDMLALGISFFDPSNPLVELNTALHSSELYNGFQLSVNALAIFTGATSSTMKCFVAGTMILTVAGLVAIEDIRRGDKVISTNVETFEVAEKMVLETYIRETTELITLTISGEVIRATYDHPFYVKDVGFVGAGELYIGDKLIDSNGNVLTVENLVYETPDNPATVYNFQVEDFHTYHVGESGILVHNANYGSGSKTSMKVTSNLGNEIDITPSANHTTTTKNPGLKGTPNSSIDIVDSVGNIKTRRWFDSEGVQMRDVDFTNHGNPKLHPEWPHEHGTR